MARKTTNRRLGILGGISILGTTGIVRPFSTASWRASVVQAVTVMAAQGERTVVLCTGGRTETGARGAAARSCPRSASSRWATSPARRCAGRRSGRHGPRWSSSAWSASSTKLAAGVLMTHYTRSKVDLALLGPITAAVGRRRRRWPPRSTAANTARHAYELWEAAGLLRPAGDLLCRRVADVLHPLRRGAPSRSDVAMVDFAGRTVVAASGAGGRGDHR